MAKLSILDFIKSLSVSQWFSRFSVQLLVTNIANLSQRQYFGKPDRTQNKCMYNILHRNEQIGPSFLANALRQVICKTVNM